MSDLETLNRRIARRLLNARKNLRLSQLQFAQKSGLPRSTIARIESGLSNPSLDILLQICQAAEVSMVEMLAEPADYFRVYESKEINKVIKEKQYQEIELNAETYLIEIEEDKIWSAPEHYSKQQRRIFCESGKVTIMLETRMVQLSEGEMLEFSSEQKTRIISHEIKSKIIIFPTGSQYPTPRRKEELR